MPATEESNSESGQPKKWQCGDPYQYPITEEGDPWQKLLKPLLEKDHDQCESWKDEVQNLLIFAGLFSGVITAFVLASYSSLQPDQNEIMISLLARITTRLDNPVNGTSSPLPDPASLASPISSSSILINVFWFISLVLSLTSALIGIVSLQWLREHQKYLSTLSSREKFTLLNMRKEGLEAWYVPQIFSSLPLLLQLALTLFFAGLINFLFKSSLMVAIPVVILFGIPFAFLIFTTTIPALQMFVFVFPLTTRLDGVPQQAPYKSIQSRLFRRFLTCSWHVFKHCAYFSHVVYHYLILLPSHLLRWRKLRQGVLETDKRLTSTLVTLQVFDALRSEDWLYYDQCWLVMRDAYSESIFEERQLMQYDNIQRSKNSAPFYDLTRGINTIYKFAKSDSTDLRLCYLCVQDITSCILDGTIPSDEGASHNRYLQNLLMPDDEDLSLSERPTTFSSLLVDPPIEFMRDENNFIFMCDAYKLSPLMAQHFAELQVRIANYLYSAKASLNLRNPLPELPVYLKGQIGRTYDKDQWSGVDYKSYFEGDISRQLSSFVKAYLEVIISPDLDETTLLKSIHGRVMAWLLLGAAIGQSSETVASTLDFLSTHIKHSMEVLFDPGVSGDIFCKPEDDEKLVVEAFLQALRQYLDARGTPDATLRERLKLPDGSDGWWDLLNKGKDKLNVLEDSKIISSKSPTIDTFPATQIGGPLPYASVPEISTNVCGQSDMSKINPDAGSLV